MELPTVKTAAKLKSPRLLTLYGASKVGKTTMLSQLDNCLIIDCEHGTDYLEALKVKVNSIAELENLMIALKENRGKYRYLALDTVDKIAEWYETQILRENKVKTLQDMPYGAGYSLLKEKVMKVIQALKNVAPRIILIGHLKKTLVASETDIVLDVSSLDLKGGLKNLVMYDSDAVGYVFREGGKMKVSFQFGENVEIGCRVSHLIGKVIDFDWKEIYID